MLELIDKDNQILRQEAQKINTPNKKVLNLIDQLFIKLATLEGVGLAAPQVGESIALAVISYKRKKDDKDIPDIPKTVLINPVICWRSKDTEVQSEACFSLPKVEVTVPRHKKIHLEFIDESGKRRKMKAKGFLARAIQHEVDHLNGILITDYK